MGLDHMNILVIGCDGQLGVCLTKALMLTQWNVRALNKNALHLGDSARVEFEVLNYKPNVIINVAAFTTVDEAEDNILAASSANHYGVINLATAAEKVGALIIHISTDYVFDGVKLDPYIESDFALPINRYGETKRAGELALMGLASKYIIIRTSWLFSEYGNNFFTKINNLLKTSSELKVVNDQKGGPTYVGDLVKLIHSILLHVNSPNFSSWGIYHYAGYPFVSWYEFACAINASSASDNNCVILPISSSSYLSRAKRPLNSCLDSSKARDIFGVLPSDWQRAIDVINGR